MRWRCALLQRWLPEYPDGNLSAFWKRRLRAHLEVCPHCRQELAEWGQIVQALKAAPVADPGQDFWDEFSREMHLKLVQAAQATPAASAAAAPRRFRMPYYLLGAPAVAVLLVWLGAHLMESPTPVPGSGLKVAQKSERALSPEKAAPAAPPQPQVAHRKAPEQVQNVSLGVQKKALQPPPSAAELSDDDIQALDDGFSSWDPEPVLSELNPQEREILLQKLRLHEKDGSCATISASVSWA